MRGGNALHDRPRKDLTSHMRPPLLSRTLCCRKETEDCRGGTVAWCGLEADMRMELND